MKDASASLPIQAGSSRRDFLRRSASVATGLVLAGPTAMAGAVETPEAATPGVARGTSEMLAERAQDCLQQVLDVARGPGGLIISHSRFDTRRPLQEGEDLSPNLSQVLDSVWGPESPKPTPAEWYYGENTNWATGYLLWSQMIRYRVTDEAEALAIARKCFRDLNHVFDLSGTIEPGLLGKPHGGRAGGTTSFDQSANPILHYVAFARDYGTAEEKTQAHRNMLAHGDYYFRRNWVMNHHGNFERIVEPAHPSAMKYLACVHAAYDVTGEARFRDAAIKYVRQITSSGKLPWPARKYDLNGNLFYYSWLGEYWTKTAAADAADWVGLMRTYWEVAQKGLDSEGLLLDGIYDSHDRIFTPTAEGWSEGNPPTAGHKQTSRRWWRSPTGYQGRTGYTLSIAILGLLVKKRGLDDRAHEVSRKILLRIGRDGFRQHWDNGRLPPETQPFVDMFGSEFPGQWMIAYWLGREQRLW